VNTVSVKEDTEVGAVLIDLDVSINEGTANVSLSVHGPYTSMCTFNGTALVLTKSLDFEEEPEYVVEIR